MGILAGTVFVTNNGFPSASAIAYGNGAQIDGNFDVNNNVRPAPGFAYLAYGNNGGIGQFKSGTTANIGYRKGGKFGFITLSTLVTGVPLRTQITVSQRGIDIANSTSIFAGDCNTLPVELSSFKAEAKENAIALLWETASELNNAGFEVERSENGKTFKAISFVEGKGTTAEANRYSFTDATAQKGKNYYYRLKQIDFDGQFEYSKVITAQINAGKEVQATLIPNPSQQGITQLQYVATESGDLSVGVYDMVGKKLYDYRFEVAAGENTMSLNLDQLAKGVYFVRLTQGDYKTYQQLIIE
ncbi:MAG: T9SS type A sorting domain-containing protein [Saprospiraceae bacterium]|nr:T9SS type A sorting domain-containing protein [Saprospiraceae bacterium]